MRSVLCYIAILATIFSLQPTQFCHGGYRKRTRTEISSINEELLNKIPVVQSSQCNSQSINQLLMIRGGEKASPFSLQFWVKKLKSFINSFLPRSMQMTSKKHPKSATKTDQKSKSMNIEELEKSISSSGGNSRLQKELRSFLSNPPEWCELSVGKNIRIWVVKITGPDGTIYAGEKFKLKMIFPKDYPSKPPSVYFVKGWIPRHVHVYTNGDICLNLLGKDWRPSMTAQTLAVSIISMISSAKEKKIPQDNAMHADAPPGQQQEGWMYHDDRC